MSESVPYFQAHLFFCTNRRPPEQNRRDCASGHAAALGEYLKVRIKEEGLKQVKVTLAGCLHRCSMGPVLVIYPQGVWYSFSNQGDMEEILESHLKGGRPVARLMLPGRPPETEGA